MLATIKNSLRVLVTLLIVALAIYASARLWDRYNRDPWTRDGRVRADVVLVSPDVNGLVTRVAVRDGQEVRTGDTHFVIDSARYELALAQSYAAIAAYNAQLAQAEKEARRNRDLGNLATTEQSEETNA